MSLIEHGLILLKQEEKIRIQSDSIENSAKIFKQLIETIVRDLKKGDNDNNQVNKDISKLLNALMASSIRITSLYIEPKDGYTKEVGTVGICFEMQKILIEFLFKYFHNLDNKTIVQDCLLKISKLLLIIMIFLGWISSNVTSLDSDSEFASKNALEVFGIAIKCLQKASATHPSLLQISGGPPLAQMITNTLSLSKHRSKELSNAAITLLSSIMDISLHPSIISVGIDVIAYWRTFLPGLFSTLFVLSNADYKRGSILRGGALKCLLRVTCAVMSDTCIDNGSVIAKGTTTMTNNISNNDNLSHDGNNHTNAMDAFNLLMTKATGNNIDKPAATSTSFDTAANSNANLNVQTNLNGMPFVAVNTEWRTDLLQRVRQFVPIAWNNVITTAAPNLQVSLLNRLECLLVDCICFLGFPQSDVSHTLLLLLVRQLAHINNSVRKYAIKSWCRIRNNISTDNKRQLRSYLIGEVTAGLATLSSIVKGTRDEDLIRRELERSIGAVIAAMTCEDAMKTTAVLRSVWNIDNIKQSNTMNDLISILQPVIEQGVTTSGGIGVDYGIHSRLLRMNNITYKFQEAGIQRTFSVGYLGIPHHLEAIPGQNGEWFTRTGRQLCLMFGCCGMTKLLLDVIRSCKRSKATDSSILGREAGAWKAIGYSVLGSHDILHDISDSENHDIPDPMDLLTDYHKIQSSNRRKTMSHSSIFVNSSEDSEYSEVRMLFKSIKREIITVMREFMDEQTKRAMEGVRENLIRNNFKRDDSSDLLLNTSPNEYRTVTLSDSTTTEIVGRKNKNEERLLQAIVVSNALETLASVATLMGSDFNLELSDVLFPLLQLAADRDDIVGTAASSTLRRISFIMGYNNAKPQELIRDNLDHITNSLSEAFGSMQPLQNYSSDMVNTRDEFSDDDYLSDIQIAAERMRLAFVINVVFRSLPDTTNESSSTRAPLSLSRELVSDLLETVDSFGDVIVVPQSLLMTVVYAMQTLLVCSAKPSLQALESNVAKRFYSVAEQSSSIARLLGPNKENLYQDYKNQADVNQGINPPPVTTPDENDDDGTPSPNLTQKLLLDVLERCMTLLAVPDPSIQNQVINTIGAGLLRLAEDRRQLLPLVHRIWIPIVARLREQVSRAVSISQEQSKKFLIDQMNTSRITVLDSRRVRTRTRDSSLLDLEKDCPSNSSVQSDVTLKNLCGQGSDNGRAQKNLGVISRSMREMRRQEMNQLPSPVLLPDLWSLLSLIVSLCGDFLVFKFKEDLWPSMKRLLQHSYSHTLWIVMYRTEFATPSATSLYFRWLESLLSCIQAFAINTECESYFNSVSLMVAWLVLPGLSSSLPDNINDIVLDLLQSLVDKHDYKELTGNSSVFSIKNLFELIVTKDETDFELLDLVSKNSKLLAALSADTANDFESLCSSTSQTVEVLPEFKWIISHFRKQPNIVKKLSGLI